MCTYSNKFFGDSQREQDYDDFLHRAQNDPTSISEQEAVQRDMFKAIKRNKWLNQKMLRELHRNAWA